MSSSGAYEGEMASEHTSGGADVAAFLDEMRATYVAEPDEAVASRHLAAMTHEAEVVLPRHRPEPNAPRRIMNRNRFLRPVATLGAATIAALLGTAGLAAAGVDLPDGATNAFERAGITLPNQARGGQSGEHARSDEVHAIIEDTPPSERGCEFGHRVAEAAKDSALPDQAQDACSHGQGSDKTNRSDSGEEHSQFGQDTSEQARGLKDATVEQRKEFGKQTSTRARENGGAPDTTAGSDRSPDTEGGTTGVPEGTPQGPPDTATVPDDTPAGTPEGTPGGQP
jgi:hypothetical protein